MKNLSNFMLVGFYKSLTEMQEVGVDTTHILTTVKDELQRRIPQIVEEAKQEHCYFWAYCQRAGSTPEEMFQTAEDLVAAYDFAD